MLINLGRVEQYTEKIRKSSIYLTRKFEYEIWQRIILKLQESGETYLETILVLKQKQGYVRSIDVATELGFSKASISRAMSILKEAGYIEIEPSGNIILTDIGHERATSIYERHVMISLYLEKVLGVSKDTAEADACRIEHIISEESFLKIKDAVSKFFNK